jgi:hypothetical protein
MTVDPRSYNQPQRHIFAPDKIDDVAQALLSLTREIWVLTDRVRCLEAVIDAHGIPVSKALESFEPDATLQAELDGKAQALVRSVVTALGVKI